MRSALLLSAALVLSACTIETPAVPIPEPGPSCGAEGLQGLVGQHSRVLQTMRFAVPVRVIRPGMAVTTDYREDRLNIEVDARERITRVYCG
ncbi:MAG TPA: I78 family peptidase inhibitor [Paracoccaceae bacterium]|nr:I78 family peptidase inhibitor [Paracoccaceae bacterium]HMO71710.1 I78 family peptidase inhibitor [Paracoccaceae bacterium]